jgi:superfamily II DNA or RNA helicase
MKLLNQLEYPKTLEYSSDGNNLPIEFFMLTVPLCKRIDLKLGYFSSNAIRTLAYGFAQFIYNGGHLRIITNHFLSYQDKMLLAEDESNSIVEEENIKHFVEKDLEGLAEILKNGDQHFFNCLKYLLKTKRLEIIPVKLKPNRLAHYKQGIMDDGINQVYFSGSCNFTYKGLIDNGESLTISRSWGEESERLKIQENNSAIDSICKKEDLAFEYLVADQIIEVINSTGKDKLLDELVEDELNICDNLSKHPKLAKTFKNYTKIFRQRIEEEKLKPRFPYPEGPREYQKEAYKKWVANDYKGIFAMATGTGKTITSLNCVLQESLKNNEPIYHAIILVPTITLVNQWTDEARRFNFQEIIKVSSKNPWEGELATTLSIVKRLPISFIIITTYATFVKDRFNKYLKDFPKDTIFIADEAHNIGSPSALKRLKNVSLQKRIGLSATPKRIYDIEGSKIMESFFSDSEPYTYSFSMERAIEEGILCKYYYYPHIVTLTSDELKEYIEITKKISKFFNKKSGVMDDNDIVQKLLLKRKRIIHKAVNKLDVTRQILESRFKKEGQLKYTFIYVPEGSTPEIYEDEHEDEETIKIINQYTREIGRIDDSIKVNQFISGMADRNEVLDQFKGGKIHVIASMKCLDEGVDIPRAEYAIFCSSTGNPRQFIQRRGRIIRQRICC